MQKLNANTNSQQMATGRAFVVVDTLRRIHTAADENNSAALAQGGVVYICGEGRGSIKRRFRAWEQRLATGPVVDTLRRIHTAADEDNSAALAQVSEKMRALSGRVFVVHAAAKSHAMTD